MSDSTERPKGMFCTVTGPQRAKIASSAAAVTNMCLRTLLCSFASGSWSVVKEKEQRERHMGTD